MRPPLLAPIHFIGLGGAGMSGIARICLDRGLSVSGSDIKSSTTLDALSLSGATVFVGHAEQNIADARTVVISSAIKEENIELHSARSKGIPVISRAQALATLLEGFTSIAVAGTHGKTTTTSMLTIALQRLGMDPSFAIGGTPHDSRANSHQGKGSIFVVEADESDGSFVEYHPDYAIVTNVEVDHVDHFADSAEIDRAFDELIGTVRKAVVLCADDPGSARLAVTAKARALDTYLYGEAANADLRISHIHSNGSGSRYRASWQGKVLGETTLSVVGRHNVLNSAAALATLIILGAPHSEVITALGEFTGVARRFETRGIARGIRIIDDYAHHPTEVRATIAAARLAADGGKVRVIFQPHRYSRTLAFSDEFADALAGADQVVLLDIYSAGEEALPGASSAAIAAQIRVLSGQGEFEPNQMQAIERVIAGAESGDIILTMGAGDVTSLAPAILAAINEG